MNYAVVYLVGILLISTIYWVIRGKKHYTGPRIEVKVNDAALKDYNSYEKLAMRELSHDNHPPT